MTEIRTVSPQINVVDFGARAVSGFDSAPFITLAKKYRNDNGGVLYFPPGRFEFGSNVVLDGPLEIADTGILKPRAGVTITVSGTFEAEDRQLFDCVLGGVISFTGTARTEVRATWWGPVSDPAALAAAVAAAAANGLPIYTSSLTAAYNYTDSGLASDRLGRDAGAAYPGESGVTDARYRRGDPRRYGAKGDGQWANNCSMTAGSATLTCGTARFAASDVGKKIVVHDAGPTTGGFLQPLSSSITAYISPTQVTLANAAVATVVNADRTAWATDDTAALQAAVDAFAAPAGVDSNIGGKVSITAGHYFTRGIVMPRAVRSGSNLSYNKISLVGDGRDCTILENWDIATTIQSVITIGTLANAAVRRVTGIEVVGLEVRQVKHATGNPNALFGQTTQDVQVHHCRIVGWSYEGLVMGGSNNSIRWYVHDNELGPCGRGGPGYPLYTSALNMNGEDWLAERNTTILSGQGAEVGSRRGVLRNNVLDGTGVPASGGIGVNFGSTGTGIWKNELSDNTIRGYVSAIQVVNTIGTINRTRILRNTIEDGGIVIQSGLESNGVLGVGGAEVDTVVHGITEIHNNTQIFSQIPSTAAMNFGGNLTPYMGLESIDVKGHTVVFTSMYCDSGSNVGGAAITSSDCPGGTARIPIPIIALNTYGGSFWPRSTAVSVGTYAVPSVDNGLIYKCTTAGTTGATEPTWTTATGSTVADNGVVWTLWGRRPIVRVTDLTVTGPFGCTGAGTDITFNSGSRRNGILFDGVRINYAWRTASPPDSFDETIPANSPYSDTQRYAETAPTAGVFALGARVTRRTSFAVGAGGEGWKVTRAGVAAPAWVASTVYAFRALVVPTADNAHYYRCIVPGTSGATQPVWPTGAGATVVDGTATWQECGAAVLFTAAP